jgi:nucleotidyltransferase/DNA polymerase involved in DNA repair
VKPDGLVVVPPGEEEAFMHERPVEDVAGVGRVTAEMLRQINVTHVKHLKRMPRRYLEALFGRRAPLICERLRGRDPYVAPSFPRSISRETSFTRPTTDLEEITATLYYLSERACRAARALAALPRRIEVKTRYGDGGGESGSAAYGEPRVLDRAVFAAASRLLAAMHRRCRMKLVGVALSQLAAADYEQECLYEDLADRRLSNLYCSLDSIRSKFGHAAIVAGQSVNLMNRLERDSYGYILRTPSLTK